jgi:hypothetical protein
LSGEIGPDGVAFGNCLQHEVLSDGQRRIVRGKQPLDPARCQQGDPTKSLSRLTSVGLVAWARGHIS